MIVLDDGRTKLSKNGRYPGLANIEFVEDELSLFRALEQVVLELDPDVLTSFELQNDGWGFISARYRYEFGGGTPRLVYSGLNVPCR
jgi:DNA polymerase elongation subunit (family B)